MKVIFIIQKGENTNGTCLERHEDYNTAKKSFGFFIHFQHFNCKKTTTIDKIPCENSQNLFLVDLRQ